MKLQEGRRATIALLVRSKESDAGVRSGLGPSDIVCRLRRTAADEWMRKELTPENWQDAGHGVYLLTIEPEDLGGSGPLLVRLDHAPDLRHGIHPLLERFEVVEAAEQDLSNVMRTTVTGRVASIDLKGKCKAQVSMRLAVSPLVIGGVALTNEPVVIETDENGWFQLALITGATVNVQIPATGYQKQFVVPPPPASGDPLLLFSL